MTEDQDINQIMLHERAKALTIIESWESRVRILFQDFVDLREEEEGIEDIEDLRNAQMQEQLETLREDLFEQLKAHFSETQRDVPSKTYEQAVYALISDRMRRYYGYYEAINRARTEANALNNEVGDQVFEVDITKVVKLLQSIDEIYFIKYLCTGLGLDPVYTDKIVNYQIDREFRPKK